MNPTTTPIPEADQCPRADIINLPILAPNLLPDTTNDETLKDNLIRLLATSYVRHDTHFYHIDRPHEPLSRDNLQRSFLYQAQAVNGGQPIAKSVVKEVFDTAIIQSNPNQYRSIPVWGGSIVPYPGNPHRRIQLESGSVVLNSWKQPAYRALGQVEPSGGIFILLFYRMFPREQERNRVLDWLAWSLQNEDKKPNWAVMLYSQSKGTGKSTISNIAARLFGEENTSRQNNLEKVAGKFNGPLLTSKLIISEEVELRAGSEAGNKIKTLITESHTTTKRKGRDVERVPLHACFLLTSNHLPTWIEAHERRFYVVDVSHDGHASGPGSGNFTQLIGRVIKALQNDSKVAGFYNWLLQRKLAPDFDAMTLNTALHGTDLMRRIEATQIPATTQQLAEYIGAQEAIAITEEDLRVYVRKTMHINTNTIQHMMGELGWTRLSLKWGGKDYARAIWVAPLHTIDHGNIYGPNGSKQAVCDALWASEQSR